MVKKQGKYEYENVQVLFKKVSINNDENLEDNVDMKLFKYLETKGKVIGMANYLKQLLYEDMLKSGE